MPHALAGDWPFELLARTGLDRIPAVRIELARGAIVKNEPARAVALHQGTIEARNLAGTGLAVRIVLPALI